MTDSIHTEIHNGCTSNIFNDDFNVSSISLNYSENGDIINVQTSSLEHVQLILNSKINTMSVSKWNWIRLPDGSLIFGLFPQGDFYLEIQEEIDV